MRKKEKNKKVTQAIILFVVFIFIASTFAAVLLYKNDSPGYNPNSVVLNYSGVEYNFALSQDSAGNYYYSANGGGSSFISFFLPQQLSSLPIDAGSEEILKNAPFLYLSFSPDRAFLQYIDYLRFDLRENFAPGKAFIDAMTAEETGYELPLVTCNNATEELPAVIMRISNTTNITSSGYCVNIDFAEYDILRVRDMMVYLPRGIGIR